MHASWVRCVAFAREERCLLTASRDGSLKVCDLLTEECIAAHSADGAFCSLVVYEDLSLVVAGDSLGFVHFLRMQGF